MKYLWYAFLGLFSLGFLGMIAGIAGTVYIISYFGRDLPDYSQLKDYKPPIVSRLYAGDGRLMAEFAQERRVFMPIETIPDLVKNAFIAAEDKNFYTHNGIDYIAITRAMVSNLQSLGSGRRPEGASTITQQVAKNFLLSNEVSYKRKIREAILAYRMEKAMSKDRLLELYLNEIYMGARSYGVAAAALRYFDKPLDELTVDEAAYLGALPKAPNNYHPVRYKQAAIQRRNWVIERMADDGFITRKQRDVALVTPLQTKIESDTERFVRAPYFAEEIRRTLQERYGEESLYGGGLVVRSTMDPELQDIAVKSLRKGLRDYDHRHGYRGPIGKLDGAGNWHQQLAAMEKPEGMLDNWEMAVVLSVNANNAKIGFINRKNEAREGTIPLANLKWARKSLNEGYQQGPAIESATQVLSKHDVVLVAPVEDKEEKAAVYSLEQVPVVQGALIALDPHTGRVLAMEGGWKQDSSQFNRATQAKRQPGSAFKPFIYLAALDNGFTPATMILDAPFVMEDRPGNTWKPTNYSNEYYGPTPLRVGVEKSRNLMTVRLADYLGMDKVAEYANKLGITENMPKLLANSLGSSETTLLDLTRAYAILVNGGKDVTPTFIDRIQDRRGNTVFRHDERICTNCGDLVRWENEAQPVPDIPDPRKQLLDPRTAYQTVSILEGVVQRGTAERVKSLGRPLAGKTGTTNRSNDAWFIGFSPDLVVGVYTGFDVPRSLGKRETGASVAVPIFKDFMELALADKPPTPFRVPNGIRNVQINAETGARAKPGDKEVIWESFITGTEPTDKMYILDGRGINLMPSSIVGSAGAGASTGTGGLY